MVSKLLIFAFALCSTLNVLAQELSGFITNNRGEAVDFMNVGVLGKNAGTVSNKDGYFSFNYKEINENDTLRFSMIGYESLDILLGDFENESTIIVIEAVYKLPDTVIEGNRFKNEQYFGNKAKSSGASFNYTGENLGGEIAQIIKVKKKDIWLKEAQLFVIENKFDSVVFRINIYNIDKKKKPRKSLLTENLIYTFTQKSGVIKMDLSHLNIVLSENFALSLEIIDTFGDTDIKDGLSFGGGIWNGPVFFRETSQANWENLKTETPFIINPGMGFGVLGKY